MFTKSKTDETSVYGIKIRKDEDPFERRVKLKRDVAFAK